MAPVRLNDSTAKKMVVSIARYLRPRSPRISSAMFTRTKSRAISATPWPRPGTTDSRREATQNSPHSASVATTRTSMIR